MRTARRTDRLLLWRVPGKAPTTARARSRKMRCGSRSVCRSDSAWAVSLRLVHVRFSNLRCGRRSGVRFPLVPVLSFSLPPFPSFPFSLFFSLFFLLDSPLSSFSLPPFPSFPFSLFFSLFFFLDSPLSPFCLLGGFVGLWVCGGFGSGVFVFVGLWVCSGEVSIYLSIDRSIDRYDLSRCCGARSCTRPPLEVSCTGARR